MRRHSAGAALQGALLAVGIAVAGLAWAGPVPPAVAATPTELAAQLVEAERALRAEATSAEAAAVYGHRQQRIYRALIHDPTTLAAVRAALPPDIGEIVDTNVFATQQIAGTVTRARRTVPAWRIVAPAPAEELQSLYRAAESEYGVPWHVLAAIHLVETRMGRLRGTSPAGARGPMQFIPETWARFGEGSIESNADSIRAAARHLVAHGAPANTRKALWHYNPTDKYGNAVLGYSSLMADQAGAYTGYYHWQVYYRTVRGVLWLPEGYEETAPVAVDAWCARPEATCGEPAKN